MNPRATHQQRFPRVGRRRGIAIIPLLAAFAIVSVLCAAWSKAAIVRSRDLRLREDRIQTRWLAEAGVRRAAARLAADATYSGENWEIAAADLGRSQPGRVIIAVEPADNLSGRVRIVAHAAYPSAAPRVATTRTVTFLLPSAESSP